MELTSSQRTTGWTVERQRRFLDHLAVCGTVADACELVGLSAASAYRLRSLPAHAGFAAAWDAAIVAASPRLVANAFERALHGGLRQVWRNGEHVITDRTPSDRLLMWLIDRIGPNTLRGPSFRTNTPEPAATPLIDAAEDDTLKPTLGNPDRLGADDGFRPE